MCLGQIRYLHDDQKKEPSQSQAMCCQDRLDTNCNVIVYTSFGDGYQHGTHAGLMLKRCKLLVRKITI